MLIGGKGCINEEKFNVFLEHHTNVPDLFKSKSGKLDFEEEDNDGFFIESCLENKLDAFDVSVIQYISGYVVKKVALSSNCVKCLNFLLDQNDEKYLFTTLKEKYVLLHPRKEIVKIFKLCELKMKEIREIIMTTIK